MRILYFTSPDFKSSTLVSVIFPPNILNHFFVVCVLVVSYVNFLEQLIFQITHISITFVAVQYQYVQSIAQILNSMELLNKIILVLQKIAHIISQRHSEI